MYRPPVLSRPARVALVLLCALVARSGWAPPACADTIPPTLQEVPLDDEQGVAFDEFGTSVAISGNTAIVGAINRGAAYVFVRNGATWALQQKLPAVDAPGEGFGERGGGWVRLSLAVTDEVLTEGLERLRAAFA